MTDLTALPQELHHAILTHLTIKDMASYAQVNRAGTAICEDETLWRLQYQRRFSNLPKDNVYSWRQLYKDRVCAPYIVIDERVRNHQRMPANCGVWMCSSPLEVATTIVNELKSHLLTPGTCYGILSARNYPVPGTPHAFYDRPWEHDGTVVARYYAGLRKLICADVTRDMCHEEPPSPAKLYRGKYTVCRDNRRMIIL